MYPFIVKKRRSVSSRLRAAPQAEWRRGETMRFHWQIQPQDPMALRRFTDKLVLVLIFDKQIVKPSDLK